MGANPPEPAGKGTWKEGPTITADTRTKVAWTLGIEKKNEVLVSRENGIVQIAIAREEGREGATRGGEISLALRQDKQVEGGP